MIVRGNMADIAISDFPIGNRIGSKLDEKYNKLG